MTTPNEELISMLRAKGCPDWVTARWLMESAAELLQSQAERIAELEANLRVAQMSTVDKCAEIYTLRAQLADAELHTKQVERGLDKATVQLAAIAATEPVAWMSPGKERLEFSRKDTVYGSHTIALFTHTMPAQDVEASMIKLPEPVELNPAANSVMGHSDATLKQAVRDALDAQGVAELVELLEFMWRDVSMNEYAFEKLETALSKYKGAK